ncbi:MAG: hypothetical protein HY834_12135 [Devosia nanyangense]|uniref:Uncharacterized protein n=1 Tax=Devosia nanyangense TaxID=1228055 RepID=A0A933NYP8_9HYPH|nr:hypothetical protein [Devosia nanyangense]
MFSSNGSQQVVRLCSRSPFRDVAPTLLFGKSGPTTLNEPWSPTMKPPEPAPDEKSGHRRDRLVFRAADTPDRFLGGMKALGKEAATLVAKVSKRIPPLR